jgi:hypothetical protein
MLALFAFVLGFYVAKHDWSDLWEEEIDCTHSWRGTDHCYVCGIDR